MGRYDWDDSEDDEFWDDQDQKVRDKNFRTTKEFKKKERRDAAWAWERDTRDR
jgi:hypothetical protein